MAPPTAQRVGAERLWLRFVAFRAPMEPYRYRGLQESEVVNAGHRPRLQMLVTDPRLRVAAIILRLETRPAPARDGPRRRYLTVTPLAFLMMTLAFLNCFLRAAGAMPCE